MISLKNSIRWTFVALLISTKLFGQDNLTEELNSAIKKREKTLFENLNSKPKTPLTPNPVPPDVTDTRAVFGAPNGPETPAATGAPEEPTIETSTAKDLDTTSTKTETSQSESPTESPVVLPSAVPLATDGRDAEGDLKASVSLGSPQENQTPDSADFVSNELGMPTTGIKRTAQNPESSIQTSPVVVQSYSIGGIPDTPTTSPIVTNFNQSDKLWLQNLKNRRENIKGTQFKYPGPASVSIFHVKPKQKAFAYALGGSGPFDTRVASGEIGVSPADWNVSFSIMGERAQWLDPRTNTGKLSSAGYGLVCAGGAEFANTAAFIPCVGAGVSTGEFKDRDYLNKIQLTKVPPQRVKIAMIKGVYAFSLFGATQVVDWHGGYSEDVFLYGGFGRVLISTPVPTVYIGVQSHGIQRNAAIFGTAISL